MTRSRRARLPRRDVSPMSVWRETPDLPPRGDGKTCRKKEMVNGRGMQKKCGAKRRWGHGGVQAYIKEAAGNPPSVRRRGRVNKVVVISPYSKNKILLPCASMKSVIVGEKGLNMRGFMKKYSIRINVPKQQYKPYVTVSGKPFGLSSFLGELHSTITPSATFNINQAGGIGKLVGHDGRRKALIESKYGVKLYLSTNLGYIIGAKPKAEAAATAINSIVAEHTTPNTESVLDHVYREVSSKALVQPVCLRRRKHAPVTKVVLEPVGDFKGAFTVVGSVINCWGKKVTSTDKKVGKGGVSIELSVPVPLFDVANVVVSMPPYTSKAPKEVAALFYCKDGLMRRTVGVTQMSGCVYRCNVHGP